jgi:O-antigen/teichoic acid export membrane protein
MWKNVLAAIAGQAGRTVVSLISVPLYLPLLGAEAFGLVGFHASLMAVLALIDGGLGVAANREVARRLSLPATAATVRDFTRTLEVVYWGIGLILAVICLALSGWFAAHWLSPKELTLHETSWCLALLGASIALRWPSALYSGILTGSQKLVFLNAVSLAVGIGYGIGGYVVLKWVSPSPLAFFTWQLLVSAVEVALLGFYCWKILPPGHRHHATFQWADLKSVRRFAMGNATLALVTVGLTNADRFLIGKMFSLQSLGSYTVGAQVNAVVSRVGGIIHSLCLPGFAAGAVKFDPEKTGLEFHRILQITAVLVFPGFMLLITLIPEILQLWLRNSPIAAEAVAPAQWFVAGTAFNTILMVPHTLLLAHGVTSFAIRQNVISLFLYLPLLYFLVKNFGVAGGAMAWAVLNAGYYLISAPLMTRRILQHTSLSYIFRVTGLPLLLSILLGIALHQARVESFWGRILCHSAAGLGLVAGLLLIHAELREMACSAAGRLKRRFQVSRPASIDI